MGPLIVSATVVGWYTCRDQGVVATNLTLAGKITGVAVLSRSNRYLFIMAPRTGCTAVGDQLVKNFGGQWFPPENYTDAMGKVLVERKHSTLRGILEHGLLSEPELSELTVLTSVRNPFDSVVSLWHKQANAYQPLLDDPNTFIHRMPGFKASVIYARDHDFPQWVEYQYGHLRGERPRHLYAQFLFRANTIMKFERLHEDFNTFLREKNIVTSEQTIPIMAPTVGRDPDIASITTIRVRNSSRPLSDVI